MVQIRMILFGLLCILLINLYELLFKKVKGKWLVIECLVIILMLIPIYLLEIDYLDLSAISGNPLDFILILIVGIISIITMVLSLKRR